MRLILKLKVSPCGRAALGRRHLVLDNRRTIFRAVANSLFAGRLKLWMFTANTRDKPRGFARLRASAPAQIVDIWHCLLLRPRRPCNESTEAAQTDKTPHRSLWGLKQVPPSPTGAVVRERSVHLRRTDIQTYPPHPSTPPLIVTGNLWGRPVSQVLETDDMRPLIGCLQRRRQQQRPRRTGFWDREQERRRWTDWRGVGRGWWVGGVGVGGRDEDKVGQADGVAEECQGRGVVEVEVEVREKVSRWAERQFSAGDRCRADKVYLTPTPGRSGHRGGRRPCFPPSPHHSTAQRKTSVEQRKAQQWFRASEVILSACGIIQWFILAELGLHNSTASHHSVFHLFFFSSWLAVLAFMYLAFRGLGCPRWDPALRRGRIAEISSLKSYAFILPSSNPCWKFRPELNLSQHSVVAKAGSDCWHAACIKHRSERNTGSQGEEEPSKSFLLLWLFGCRPEEASHYC